MGTFKKKDTHKEEEACANKCPSALLTFQYASLTKIINKKTYKLNVPDKPLKDLQMRSSKDLTTNS